MFQEPIDQPHSPPQTPAQMPGSPKGMIPDLAHYLSQPIAQSPQGRN